MTRKMNPATIASRAIIAGLIFWSAAAGLARGQIVSDGTTGTRVEGGESSNFEVVGGRRSGSNLFHSFQEFSVPEGGSATFQVSDGVENAIARVTGSTRSSIDGLIRVSGGDANLILLNPNGIIFGVGASLDLGGSFLASTAEELRFADGTSFSTATSESAPILTVSTPIGLHFGSRSGQIINSARGPALPSNEPSPLGLEVQPNRTLALLGTGASLVGGNLATSTGKIEIASVAVNSVVGITPAPGGWNFDYQGVPSFRDINLEDKSGIRTKGEGEIRLRGRRITLGDRSEIVAFNSDSQASGAIEILASDSLELREGVFISSRAIDSSEPAGTIAIETGQLLLDGDSSIDASTEGVTTGRGGAIAIQADSIAIQNFSNISAVSFSPGNAGEIAIVTNELISTSGGRISAEAKSSGRGGRIAIDANSIQITGTAIDGTNEIASSIRTVAVAESQGAGDIEIEANSLLLENGGEITATTKAGESDIALDIAGSSLLRGNSSITTSASGTASGGNIFFNTDTLILLDNSSIQADAGDGSGGRAVITTTRGIFRSADSEITASSALGPEFDGVVEINLPEVDLSQGLLTLPDRPELPRIALGCQTRGSRFTYTGRGGLRPSSDRASGSDLLLEAISLRSPALEPSNSNPLREARGWVKKADGTVVLTANVSEPACF